MKTLMNPFRRSIAAFAVVVVGPLAFGGCSNSSTDEECDPEIEECEEIPAATTGGTTGNGPGGTNSTSAAVTSGSSGSPTGASSTSGGPGDTASSTSGGGNSTTDVCAGRPAGCSPNFNGTACICEDAGFTNPGSVNCPGGDTASYNNQTYACTAESVWGTCPSGGGARAGGSVPGQAACELFCDITENSNLLPPCDPPPSDNSNCMQCHNGAGPSSPRYSGVGLEDPHPWRSADGNPLGCSTCHGGDPASGMYKDRAHVCNPVDIEQTRTDNGRGRWEGVINNQYGPRAWSRYLHKAGLDKSQVDGIVGIPDQWICRGPDGNFTRQVTKIDYLQFIAPGDLRVVDQGKSCGSCHVSQAKAMPRSVIGTSIGLVSTARFEFGVPNAIVGRDKWAPDYGPRAITALANPSGTASQEFRSAGQVDSLLEATFVQEFEANDNILTTQAAQMATGVENNAAQDQQAFITYGYNRIRTTNSDLAKAVSVAFVKQCGDCHAGDSGQNNTTGDYRGSGCSGCHMEYGFDGRYRGSDPNLNNAEPVNPDFIYPGERPHVREHVIRGRYRRVARQGQQDQIIYGINSVRACVGCHQGSNRTVLQYTGIRLDQNQDVVNNRQYPGNPIQFRFADEFQGRDGLEFYNIPYGPNVTEQTTLLNNRLNVQYIYYEDYGWRNIFYDPNFGGTPNANDFGNRAASNRDDTPPDIHYERGMECYDCHKTDEMHGTGRIYARADHALSVSCESCHGNADRYAPLTPEGFAMDRFGQPLKHVYKDQTGRYFLIGKRDGVPHFLPQIRDLVSNASQVSNPRNNQPMYAINADFAMGRIDADFANGKGPLQQVVSLDSALAARGFSHLGSPDDRGGLTCYTCHTSWENQCIGCHLDLQARQNVDAYQDITAQYANNNNGGIPNYGFPWANSINQNFLNNINGEYVYTTINANFTYIDIGTFYIGVGSRGRIVPFVAQHNWFNYIDFAAQGLQNNMTLLGTQVAATAADYTYGAVAQAKGLFSDRYGAGSSAGNRNRMVSAGGQHQFMPHSQRGRAVGANWGGYGTACFHCHLTADTFQDPSAQDLVRTTTGLGAITYKKWAADKFGCPQNFINCELNATINQPAGIANCANGTALDNQQRFFNFNNAGNLCDASTVNNNPQTIFADYDQFVTAGGIANAKNSHKLIEFGGVQRQGALDFDVAGPLGVQHLQLLNNLNNSGIVLTHWVDFNGDYH